MRAVVSRVASMFIRQEQPSDADAIRELHRRAFAKPATDDAPPATARSRPTSSTSCAPKATCSAPLCLVAERDGASSDTSR